MSERQSERLDRLNVARTKEQRRVDEASMRIKHENMKAIANFLTTSTEPKLYYKPWELLPEQDEQINRQREDTDALIDQELDDFDQVRQRWQKEDENGHTDQRNDASTEHVRDTSNDTTQAPETTPEPTPETAPIVEQAPKSDIKATVINTPGDAEAQETQEQAAEEAERHRKDSIDDTGDIVVEADEDTVIY